MEDEEGGYPWKDELVKSTFNIYSKDGSKTIDGKVDLTDSQAKTVSTYPCHHQAWSSIYHRMIWNCASFVSHLLVSSIAVLLCTSYHDGLTADFYAFPALYQFLERPLSSTRYSTMSVFFVYNDTTQQEVDFQAFLPPCRNRNLDKKKFH